MSKIKVVLIKPYDKGEVIEIENKLEEFQKLVGGYIEPIYRHDDIVLLVNEDGIMLQLEPNILGLVGNIVVVRNDGEEFTSLTDFDIEEWCINETH